MTCIVGILDKKEDCVYVGADSLASNWHEQFLLKNRKVFKAKDNENCLMAITGSVKIQNWLSIEEGLIEEVKHLKNEVNFDSIVKYTVPKIFELAKKYNDVTISDSNASISGSLLFAYKNQLYLIEQNGQVIESQDDYFADGSGVDFAMGVLSQTREKPTAERIKAALEAAEMHGRGIKRPFYILNTKNDEVIEIK
jgi:ATP-dependent protease HslVU (ClpYQ) peptidase subunit